MAQEPRGDVSLSVNVVPVQGAAPVVSHAPSWWRRWLPRPETTLLLLALAWTLGAKAAIVCRHDPAVGIASLASVTLPDIQFFAAMTAAFSLLYRHAPRPWVARAMLAAATVAFGWAVLNAAWIMATGVQLLPGVLATLLRDRGQFWPIVQAHLEHKPYYAIPIVLTLLIAVPWLVVRLARPIQIVPASRRYARRAVLTAFIAVLAYPAQRLAERRSELGFAGEVLEFSSHWQAMVASASGLPRSPDLENQTRSLLRRGERQIGMPEPTGQPLPNVVLVLLESFSHGSTSLGNKDCATTPNLAQLAAEGVEFTCTRVPIAQTTKAFWSTLTGTMPDTKGIYVEAVPVDKPYESLATLLARRGYRSAFFEMSKGTFECAPGLFANLGFDWAWFRENLQDPSANLGYLGGDDLRALDPMFQWVDGGAQPFFLMTITTVAHDPYEVPKGFATADLDPAARYRRAVEYSDFVLGQLCQRLEERGLSDNTLLCVLGDHGVSHRSADRFGRWIPYEELIRVPWVVRWPNRVSPGTRVDWPCSQVDVTPTVLTLLGYDIAESGFDGVNALAPVDANRRLYFSSGFPDCPVGYLEGRRKWVHWRTNGTVFAYDLDRDPQEQSPVVVESPEKEQIISDLDAWHERWQICVPAKRFSERWVFEHWQTFSSGRSAWAYYVP